MENNRKTRIALNYYTKNTLKKYFKIWKNYVILKQCKSNNVIPIKYHFLYVRECCTTI